MGDTDPKPQPQPDSQPHRPADDREETYFDGSPSQWSQVSHMYLWMLAGLALFFAPILYSVVMKSWPPIELTILLLVLGLAIPVVPFLLVKTTRFRITNYRIDWERGILGKSIDTLELWHVEDIKFRQSLFDRILNIGTITILSADESNPQLVMRGLPNPRPLYESLKQRIIAVKRQRGVIKMDLG